MGDGLGLTVWHDYAYLSVPEHDGFSVLFRENRTEGDISSLTTLCQDHPYTGRSRASPRRSVSPSCAS